MKSAILFCGPAGSGKDTCAKYLIRKYGFVRHAIGDSLKDVMYELSISMGFNFARSDFDDITKKDTPATIQVIHNDFKNTITMSPRDLLVKVGNDILRRRFGPDIYVKAMSNRIEESRVVITDVRYNEDVDYIYGVLRERGYKIKVLKLNPSWTSEAMEHDICEDISDFFIDAVIPSEKSNIRGLEMHLEEFLGYSDVLSVDDD